MTFTILLASPGVGLRNIEAELRKKGVDIVDVEDKLLSLDEIARDPELSDIPAGDLNLRDVLEVLPHVRIVELWRKALVSALDALDSQNSAHKVLAFHPSLFADRRSEQYSLIGQALHDDRLRNATRVILLIDDIFDMWARLGRTSSDLFHQASWLELRAEAQDLDYYFRNDGDTSILALDEAAPAEVRDMFDRLIYNSSISILEQLIRWRHLDMIEAETLATALSQPRESDRSTELPEDVSAEGTNNESSPVGAEDRTTEGSVVDVVDRSIDLVTLGVMHPVSALLNVVKSASATNPTTSYLSHPISRPRREFANSGHWPEVVGDSNELSGRLAREGVILVCPTAIDEFRFNVFRPDPNVKYKPEDLAGFIAADFSLRSFTLSERWPPLTSHLDAIVTNVTPSSELVRMGLSQQTLPRAVISTYARSLEESIFAEVPFRDHFLVAHTNTFLVYRPLYKEGRFSRGVTGEIGHWQDSFVHGEHGRRALFVHSPEDLRDWLVAFNSSRDSESIRREAWDYLHARRKSPDDIRRILASASYRSDNLDYRAKGAGDERLRVRAFDYAGKLTLLSQLTRLDGVVLMDPSAPVRIAVLGEERASETEVVQFAKFLSGTEPYVPQSVVPESEELASVHTPEGSVEHPLDVLPIWSIESVLGKSIAEWAMSVVGTAD